MPKRHDLFWRVKEGGKGGSTNSLVLCVVQGDMLCSHFFISGAVSIPSLSSSLASPHLPSVTLLPSNISEERHHPPSFLPSPYLNSTTQTHISTALCCPSSLLSSSTHPIIITLPLASTSSPTKTPLEQQQVYIPGLPLCNVNFVSQIRTIKTRRTGPVEEATYA